MKMPEKHDLLAAILAAKEQGIGAIPAFAMATFAADIMAVRLQNSNRVSNDVRHRLVHSWPSTSPD